MGAQQVLQWFLHSCGCSDCGTLPSSCQQPTSHHTRHASMHGMLIMHTAHTTSFLYPAGHAQHPE